MGILSETRFIERLQFFNGQRLFASDLQGLEAFNREMRWLHDRSLHQPGIGSGFAVYGKKGDREIKIKPGYAIDSLGREIVLTETWIEPVPPVAGEDDGKSVFYDLTVSYPEDTDLEEAETREGICLPRGVVRLREEPVFCWVRLENDMDNLHPKNTKLQNDIRDGLKIVLTRAEVLNCQLNKDLSIAERLSARPAKQPYIACGETNVTSTDWQVWFDEKSDTPLGLQLQRVDTSSAQFRTTPCYSAHIVGNRFFNMEIGEKESNFLLDGFVSVVEPNAAGFTLRVLMPEKMSIGILSVNPSRFFDQNVFEPDGRDALQKNGWHVVWMGIEG
jgi:hypothetical protein